MPPADFRVEHDSMGALDVPAQALDSLALTTGGIKGGGSSG